MRRIDIESLSGAGPIPSAPLREPSPPVTALEWIEVAPDAPYFRTASGAAWTPVGQNDAITWPELASLFRRRDLPAVEAHLRWLADSGVTVLRLMLEYAQTKHRYIENPPGRFVPAMVQLWDDLFALCEKTGLRILLTPFDTFWTWRKWRHHPYNRLNGGCLDVPSRLLLCAATRAAIKARLAFAVERWGGSGALFAWDLWNEIHPGHAEESADGFGEFIHDLSSHVRRLEQRLYGRTHPQTVSLFGPEIWWRPQMPLKEPIFRHPDLDFATIHIYREGTIDHPQDTVAPAVSTGEIVREALAEAPALRPFLDSEHGPIHTFKDYKITLPEDFDDEYFRHMQWAHLASGAAGGGMRWPNRHPHVLTPGMRRAQAALAGFLPLIDWTRFARRNLNAELAVDRAGIAAFGCGDGRQAVAWLLRTDTIGPDGRLRADVPPIEPQVTVPGLQPGRYRVTAFDTESGTVLAEAAATAGPAGLRIAAPPFLRDLALAIRAADQA